MGDVARIVVPKTRLHPVVRHPRRRWTDPKNQNRIRLLVPLPPRVVAAAKRRSLSTGNKHVSYRFTPRASDPWILVSMLECLTRCMVLHVTDLNRLQEKTIRKKKKGCSHDLSFSKKKKR